MSRFMRAAGTTCALTIAGLALMVPASAVAISLATLVGGGSLTSADGSTTFSGFSVYVDPWMGESPNDLSGLDISLIDVSLVDYGVAQGIAFDGGLMADAYSRGQIRIDYQVDTASAFAAVGADTSLKAETLGFLSRVDVVETISGDAAAALHAVASEDTTVDSPYAGTVFAAPAQHLDVANHFTLDGGMTDYSRVARLEQTFTVSRVASPVPEPGAALLFGAGTLVVAVRLRPTATR